MDDKRDLKFNLRNNNESEQEIDPSGDPSSISSIKVLNSISGFFKYLADKALSITNFKQAVIFFSIISAFTFLVALGSVGVFEYLSQDTQREALKEAAIESILGIMHDPQKEQGKYHYRYSQSGRAPNGLYPDVEHKNVFQKFDTDFSILRLWADPRNQHTKISANLIKSTESELTTDNVLNVKFVRAGWGVDVAIKQQDNKTAYTGNFDCLVVKAHGDVNSIGKEEKKKYDGLAFRLRVIDGRGTHWVWGEFNKTAGQPKILYNTEDFMYKPLMLTKSPLNYQFDISTRKSWVRFRDDGGIAPPKAIEEKFEFIQAVIIEPGWTLRKGDEVSIDKDELIDHDRRLGKHITNIEGIVPQPASIVIHKIYFTEACE